MVLLCAALQGCGSSGGSGGGGNGGGGGGGGTPPPTVFEENQKTGTTDWQITKAAIHQIEGYASAPSVARGGTINFLISTTSSSYTLQVFRMGWYGGKGGRSVLDPVTLTGTEQTQPTMDPTTGLVECNWTSSYTLQTGGEWASGAYLAKATTTDTNLQTYIVFVVTDPTTHSDLLYNIPFFTYEAYNAWGGKSLYDFNSTDTVAAVKVSLNRPFIGIVEPGDGDLLLHDLDMIRFLEKHGWDMTYTTDVELNAGTIKFGQYKAFITGGHPEYWTKEMRDHITAARDGGTNLGFFTGNEMFWQIRLQPSSVSSAANQTVVCYRSAATDPDASSSTTESLTTVRWRDEPVSNPEQRVLGAMYNGSLYTPADLVVSDASSWVFANTGLENGSHVPLVVDGEMDSDLGFGPANLNIVAQSPAVVIALGVLYNRNADMTWYQASSGAIVFEASSMRWSWGLEPFVSYHARPAATSAAMQQITTNVLEKFGAMPKS
ncbi:N,N-dimethylformamidase beta subunit family domain-containing protein [Candidatus Korobacter versatilis]|nr:N,N-dimethylformamidase beta subunit family domain-containing protein [Candidatus Koribacter versatilis]